jgi:hypothetical protein
VCVCLNVCDQQTPTIGRLRPDLRCWATEKDKVFILQLRAMKLAYFRGGFSQPAFQLHRLHFLTDVMLSVSHLQP